MDPRRPLEGGDLSVAWGASCAASLAPHSTLQPLWPSFPPWGLSKCVPLSHPTMSGCLLLLLVSESSPTGKPFLAPGPGQPLFPVLSFLAFISVYNYTLACVTIGSDCSSSLDSKLHEVRGPGCDCLSFLSSLQRC